MGEENREPGSVGHEPPLRVFLSYRRTDDINVVGRFHDHLLESFGDHNVFRDLDSLHGGSNFPKVIKEEIERIDAVVAMIGPTWAQRLAQPGDFVELEVSEALERGCPVVPVLIQGAPLPSREQLPESLRGLLDLNAVALRPDPDFRRDSAWAIDGILNEATAYRTRKDAERRLAEEALAKDVTHGGGGDQSGGAPVGPDPSERPRWLWWAVGAGAAALIAVVAIIIASLGGGDGGGASDDSTPDSTLATDATTAVTPESTAASETAASTSPATSATNSADTTAPDVAVTTGASEPATTVAFTGSEECRPLDGFELVFCDGFDESLDPALWAQFDNADGGGSVTFEPGSISLASDGQAFPYVVSNVDPFEGLSEYRLTVSYRFDTIGVFGTGVMAVDVEHPNGMAVGAIPLQQFARVWQDTNGQLIDTECRPFSIESDTEPHTVVFERRPDGARTVSIDGAEVLACQGGAEPTSLWLGNPSVPTEEDQTWTAVTVDFVRVDTPA